MSQALHDAIQHKNYRAIPELIRTADVNQKWEGETPLHRAAMARNMPAMVALIRQGADPAIRNERGQPSMELIKQDPILKDVAGTLMEERLRFQMEQAVRAAAQKYPPQKLPTEFQLKLHTELLKIDHLPSRIPEALWHKDYEKLGSLAKDFRIPELERISQNLAKRDTQFRAQAGPDPVAPGIDLKKIAEHDGFRFQEVQTDRGPVFVAQQPNRTLILSEKEGEWRFTAKTSTQTYKGNAVDYAVIVQGRGRPEARMLYGRQGGMELKHA